MSQVNVLQSNVASSEILSVNYLTIKSRQVKQMMENGRIYNEKWQRRGNEIEQNFIKGNFPESIVETWLQNHLESTRKQMYNKKKVPNDYPLDDPRRKSQQSNVTMSYKKKKKNII